MSRRRPVAVPGWDSVAEIVDDLYIDRSPRRPEVREGLEWECRLLPLIAPLLPLAVPVPFEVDADDDGPWRVRHRIVPGVPATPPHLTRAAGGSVGRFLRSLHALDVSALGLRPRNDAGTSGVLERMEAEVIPLLPKSLRARGAALIRDARRTTPVVLAHGDLGPTHLLVDEGAVSGVIDWTDSCLRDPAIDLAWVLNGTPEPFRHGIRDSYRPSPAEEHRAHVWHCLGPWHEVLHGQDQSDPTYLESGLAGVTERLRSGGGRPTT